MLTLFAAGVVLCWLGRVPTPSLPPPERPPASSPLSADQLLSSSEVSEATGLRMVLLAAGPFGSTNVVSSSQRAGAVRREQIVATWRQTWTAVNSQATVTLGVLERRTRAQASALPVCSGGSGTVTADRATKTVDLSGRPTVCVESTQGRYDLEVAVRSHDPKGEAIAYNVAQGLLSREKGRLPVEPDLPERPAGHVERATRTNVVLLLVVLGPLGLGVVTVLVDPPSRRWLFSHLRRRPLPVDPASLDVGGPAGVQRGLVMLASFARVLLTGLAWIVAYRLGAPLPVALGAVAVVWLWCVRKEELWSGTRWRAGSDVAVGPIVAIGTLLSLSLAAYATVQLGETATAYAAARRDNDLAADMLQDSLVRQSVLLLLAGLPYVGARRLGRWIGTPSSVEPEDVDVLVLRSFVDDGRHLRVWIRSRGGVTARLLLVGFERFEQIVCLAMPHRGHGLVVAVSPPDSVVPPAFGAVRLSFSEEEWRPRVAEMMDAASYVAVSVGRTESVGWEIGRLQGQGALLRTVFLFPPTGIAEQGRRLDALLHLLGLPGTTERPRLGLEALALVCEPGGAYRLLLGRSQDDVSYTIAIATAVRMIDVAVGERQDEAVPRLVRSTNRVIRRNEVELEARGDAEAYVPWLRREYVWGTGVGVAAMVLLYPTGAGLGFYLDFAAGLLHPGDQTYVRLPEPASLIAMLPDGRVVASASDGLYAADIPAGKGKPLGGLPDVAGGLVTSGGAIYVALPGAGAVLALDPDRAEPLWTAQLGQGVRSLALAGDNVFTVVPGAHEVVLLDRTTGDVEKRQKVAGTPWEVTVSAKSAYVSLIDDGNVAVLDASTLSAQETIAVGPGPTAVVTREDSVWVLDTYGTRMLPVTGPDARRDPVWCDTALPAVASGHGRLLVDGSHRFLVVDGHGVSTMAHTGAVRAITIDHRGHVIAAFASGTVSDLGLP